MMAGVLIVSRSLTVDWRRKVLGINQSQSWRGVRPILIIKSNVQRCLTSSLTTLELVTNRAFAHLCNA